MVKIYGIPGMIASSEIIRYNNGKHSVRVNFEGGITDPKIEKPATFTTADEFMQIVIETSPLFNVKIFRYSESGKKLINPPLELTDRGNGKKKVKTSKNEIVSEKASTFKAYPDVTTLGKAAEVLLDLGAKADELSGENAIIMAAIKYHAQFPNLKLNKED